MPQEVRAGLGAHGREKVFVINTKRPHPPPKSCEIRAGGTIRAPFVSQGENGARRSSLRPRGEPVAEGLRSQPSSPRKTEVPSLVQRGVSGDCVPVSPPGVEANEFGVKR